MKLSWNVIAQGLGTFLQIANQFGGFVPDKYKWLAAGIIGIGQGLMGIVSHFSNPDGTAAARPYVK